MRIHNLYEDENGESHFRDIEIEWEVKRPHSSYSKRLPATGIIFRETTTIGLRAQEMTRECLERHTVPVETPYGTVRVKVARRGAETLNVAPEFDDCVRVAEASGAAVKDVQAAALKAFLDRPSGAPPLA